MGRNGCGLATGKLIPGAATTMIRNNPTNRRIMLSVAFALLLAPTAAGTHAWAQGTDPDTIVFTRSDCAALVEHKPAADVEYRPGVDARGRSVVSADVAGTPRIAPPDEIAIDVTVQVYQYLGRTPPAGLGDSSTKVGRLVFSNGKLTFNGEALSGPANHAIAAACVEKFGS